MTDEQILEALQMHQVLQSSPNPNPNTNTNPNPSQAMLDPNPNPSQAMLDPNPNPNPSQAMQDLQIEQEKLQQAKKAEG